VQVGPCSIGNACYQVTSGYIPHAIFVSSSLIYLVMRRSVTAIREREREREREIIVGLTLSSLLEHLVAYRCFGTDNWYISCYGIVYIAAVGQYFKC
jgi:hypothetical protein